MWWFVTVATGDEYARKGKMTTSIIKIVYMKTNEILQWCFYIMEALQYCPLSVFNILSLKIEKWFLKLKYNMHAVIGTDLKSIIQWVLTNAYICGTDNQIKLQNISTPPQMPCVPLSSFPNASLTPLQNCGQDHRRSSDKNALSFLKWCTLANSYFQLRTETGC